VTDQPRGSLEHSVSRVLTVGTLVSIGLVAIGVALMLVGGVSPLDGAPGLDAARIPADIAGARPEGFIWLGILGLIATPSARVLASLVGFSRRGERGMVAVAVLVLVVVAAGVVTGLWVG
jgi:uncharacterized membrane protein